MIGIVVSRADSASVHIGEQLRVVTDWTVDAAETDDVNGETAVYRTDGATIREFDALHLSMKGVADAFDDPDLVVFASRHSGETGPLLSAHFTGNFGPADYGGEPGRLARAAPNALRAAIAALDDYAPAGYDVSMECTHHGPTDLDVPSLFVELGSDEDQWADPAGARAVARAILDLRGIPADRDRQIVGFGGGHYAPRFGRILRETDWAVGHVIADWGLEPVGVPDARRLRQPFDRSMADRALVDGDSPELTDRIRRLGYRVVSETWLRETTGIPLAFVDRVEEALGTIDAGVRFGDPARAVTADQSFSVVPLHSDLLGAVNGIDTETARESVRAAALAFETTDGGSRIVGRVVLADEAALDRILDAFVEILSDRYTELERVSGAIVARERVFRPELARDYDVPEGPAFGRLTAGEAVEVDGRTVEPDDVHTERTVRLPIRRGESVEFREER